MMEFSGALHIWDILVLLFLLFILLLSDQRAAALSIATIPVSWWCTGGSLVG